MKTKIGLTVFLIFVVVILATCVYSSEKATDPSVQAQDSSAETAAAAAPTLIGEWTMIPVEKDSIGGLIVREDGTYTRIVEGGSVTGPYQLDTTQSPHALDLCLGECGAPGSEWTTLVCIFRFHAADTLELRSSPTDKRFAEFAKEADEHTRLYTRKPAESIVE